MSRGARPAGQPDGPDVSANEWCSFTAEVRSHTESKAVDLVREMLETAAFAASLAECEVESEVRPSMEISSRLRTRYAPAAVTGPDSSGFSWNGTCG